MLFSSVAMLTAFSIGLRWGIEGVATGFVVASVLVVPFAYTQIRTTIAEELRPMFGDLTVLLAAFVLGGVVARVAADSLGESSSELLVVVVSGAVAGTIYLATVAAIRRAALTRWISLGRQIFSSRR